MALLGAIVSPAGAAGRPDLVASALTNPPASRLAGATFTATDTTANKGTATAAASTTRYYLSRDRIKGAGDLLLAAGRSVPKLAPGRASRGSKTVTVPTSATGAYYLVACADAGRKVAESREANNCRASTTRVQILLPAPPDTTAPGPPSLTGSLPASPSNSSTTPTITGAAEARSTVAIYASETCSGTPLATGLATSAGTFSVVVSVTPNDTTSLRGTAKDAAGNTSVCSAAFAYTHDSRAPLTPTITNTAPASPSNSITSPTVNGTADAGSLVKIYDNDTCGGTALANGPATETGTFAIDVAVPSNTTTLLYATASDALGNESPCGAALAYTHDNLAPGPPTNLGSDPVSPTNSTATPTLFGTSEPGASIVLHASNDCSGAPERTVSADGAGLFSLFASVNRDATSHFTFRAIDTAGNVSPCSVAFTYIQDSTAPDAPLLTNTTPPSPAGENNPEIQGLAEPYSLVSLYSDPCSGAVIGTDEADPTGAFSIATTVSDNSTTTYYATATDSTTNVSACSAAPLTYIEATPDPCVDIFSEDFSDALGGWTLDPEWQIGSATASSGQQGYNPDPAEDHTLTLDNGVAGVAIGGNALTVPHPSYYLTSPIINSEGLGTVRLDFWRWLNSDTLAYMANTVEVFDGTQWVQLWRSGARDSAWTKVIYDLTAYKNLAMRVRFGFSVEKYNALKVSSWNIDDVSVKRCI